MVFGATTKNNTKLLKVIDWICNSGLKHSFQKNLRQAEMEGSSDRLSNASLKLLQRKDETGLLSRLNNNHFEHPAFDLGLFEEAKIIL